MITSLIRRSVSLIVAITALAAIALGQGNQRITHRVETEARSAAPFLGRDLWFCVPLNNDPNDNSDKIFTVYVTSEKKTVVNIQIAGQAPVKKQINPGEVWDFLLPKSVEIKGSLDIEKEKAIHVWSDDADLSVYFMSRNPFTSDGMYVLPTIGWGKEYVIASYSALLVDPKFDLPSEFCIVANQNNTVVTVVPSQDVRRTSEPTKVFHKKGEVFTITMQRGEAVQIQTVFDIGGSELDLTGTAVTANNPIGVVGASVCPFIPADPYCDHILDMLPPVRTWSKTYYTLPFFGRVIGGDSYYVIGSKAGQTILRNGNQYANLNRFEAFFRSDISEPSVWTSDAPFMLVQYLNSSRTGGSTQNQGDPAMVVVNGAEQFARKVVIQTPSIRTGSDQNQFTNYVNVVLPSSVVDNTTFDGMPIKSAYAARRYPIPGTTWEGIRLGNNTNAKVPIGTHTIVSDSGVGVYLYGYSKEDSYAWAGALGVKTPGDPDTIPPAPDPKGQCFCARVDFNDIHTAPPASKLSSFIIDSLDNVSFTPDPDFIPGNEEPNGYYEFCVLDSTKDAYLVVSIYDVAGNRTTVTSEYRARVAEITPPITNFGTVIPGNDGYGYITIENTGTSPFTFRASELKLLNGQYFFIDSTGADGDIPPGGTRLVRIRFTPQIGPTVQDTVVFGDECVKVNALVVGNGGAPDFLVFNYDFGCAKPGATKKYSSYEIINPSGGDVTIDSIWVDDPVLFGYDTTTPLANTLPLTVPRQNLQVQGKYLVEFTYSPTALRRDSTVAHFRSSDPQIPIKTATLYGQGCAPQIFSKDSTSLANCDAGLVFPVPVWNSGNLADTLVAIMGSGPSSFSITQIEDLLGNIITLPYALGAGDTIFAIVTFAPTGGASGTFAYDITVTNKEGSTVATPKVTANAYYPKATMQKDLADFGTKVFGGPKVEDYVTVCNDSLDPVTIQNISDITITGDASFALSNKFLVGGSPRTFPITLQEDECLDIYVTFDPAWSITPASQQAAIGIRTSACAQNLTAQTKANLTSQPPNITGFDAPATLSCSNRSNFVSVENLSAIDREVTNVSFIGTNPANFVYMGSYPVALSSGATINLPVQFNPDPAAGTVSYVALVIVTLRDVSSGTTILDTAQVTGIGQGIDLKISSVFADLDKSSGESFPMPVNITFDKKGLSTPIDALGISRIELSYAYNTDLLHINDGDYAAAVINLPAGWQVDKNASSYNEAGGTLSLVLYGTTPLSDNVTKLCDIVFTAMLTDKEVSTDFSLTSYRFLDGAGQPLGACVTPSSADSNFTLILRCGDATLQKFMRGEKIASSMIEPASPNPATGNAVTLRYATRFEGMVTLAIFDELGKEVRRFADHKRLPAGVYEVRGDVRSLASGTYTYRLEFDGAATSGRFVIRR